MKLASQTMMKLMAYADGELDAADVKEVEQILAKDADALRFVEQIADLGAFVKLGHGARAMPAIDIADAVMAKVKETTPDAKVVSLDARRTSRAKTGLVVAAALALAASIAFWSRPKETPMAKAPAPTAVVAETQSAVPGVVVEPIDSPGQSVKVIYGPGTTNEMTTSVIIWVDDERK